jgi:uncharacterized protein YecT (DUF1311 family)
MTKMKKVLIGLSLAVFFVVPAKAQDGEITCNRSGGTLEMVACLQDDFEKADAELNVTYKKLTAALSADDKEYGANENDSRIKRLQGAQRAWVAWRDKECALQSIANYGGSLERLDFPACLTNLTIARTKTLADVLAQGQ